MTVRFLTCIAGHGWVRNAGDVADIDDTEAKRLVTAGIAVPVKATETIETATQPQGDQENTSLPGGRKAK